MTLRLIHHVDSVVSQKCLKKAALSLGFESLKQEQYEAVTELLRGKDVFVNLPTGFGKSLIYQVLPICAREILSLVGKGENVGLLNPFVLVLSPLQSLMQDQVKRLEDMSIASIYLSRYVDEGTINHFKSGKYCVVFVSPETLLEHTHGRKLVLCSYFQENILAVVVDEAHCIVKWGMGTVFRAWYGEVCQLRSLLPNGVPFSAMTATSTSLVCKVILDQLSMRDARIISVSPDRQNIRYSVVVASRDLDLSFKWLMDELLEHKTETPKTLIFCRSIQSCSNLFKLFLFTLKQFAYFPEGSPPSVQSRLFAMYHAKLIQMTRLIFSDQCSHYVVHVG